MVLIGAYNFLLFAFVDGEQVFTQYYDILPAFLSEVVLMSIGALSAWFV